MNLSLQEVIDEPFSRLDKPVIKFVVEILPLSLCFTRGVIELVFEAEYVQVIIVGNVAEQVKFSELTLDMFRMLQTLEREPQDEMAQV